MTGMKDKAQEPPFEDRVHVRQEGPKTTPPRLRVTYVKLRGDELVWLARAAAIGFQSMTEDCGEDEDLVARLNASFHTERAQLWKEVDRVFSSLPDGAPSHEFEARLRT